MACARGAGGAAGDDAGQDEGVGREGAALSATRRVLFVCLGNICRGPPDFRSQRAALRRGIDLTTAASRGLIAALQQGA
jgi:hypothetical protein